MFAFFHAHFDRFLLLSVVMVERIEMFGFICHYCFFSLPVMPWYLRWCQKRIGGVLNEFCERF